MDHSNPARPGTARLLFNALLGPFKRGRPRRWVRLALLAISGGATVVLLGPLVLPKAQPVLHRLGPWAVWPAMVLLTIAALPAARGRWLAFSGFAYFFLYPPIWVAGLLGFVATVGFWTAFLDALEAIVGVSLVPDHWAAWLNPYVSVRFALIVAVPLFSAAVVAAVLKHYSPLRRSNRQRLRSSNGESPGVSPNFDDYDAVREWLADDREIETPAQDLFSRMPVAERIARRLAPSNAVSPTIAVVGPLGSGKSSIRNLVRHIWLRDGVLNRSVVLVPISVWGFENPSAASRGILGALTEELAKHVSIPELRGVSDAYLTAVRSTGGFFEKIAGLLRAPTSPRLVLKEFERVAAGIGLHVVLWVEDLERFAAIEAASTDNAHERDATKLGPIRALAHMLDRMDNLTVVWATTSLRTRFDLDKIARFVESLPDLDSTSVWKAVDTVRRAALAELEQAGFLDPATEEGRASFAGAGPEIPLSRIFGRNDFDTVSPREALAFMAKTPRSLKQSLRLAMDLWSRLAGEIDIDDLIVMSFIRVSEPDVFALIDFHIGELRQGPFRSRFGSKSDDAETAFVRDLNTFVPKTDRERRAAIETLLDFTFPYREDGRPAYHLDDRPQGLAVSLHADNWRRFMDGESEPMDQPVLDAIQEWHKGNKTPLINAVQDSARCEIVETFGALIGAEQILVILALLVDSLGPQPPERWNTNEGDVMSEVPVGLVSVWRLSMRLVVDKERLEQVLTGSVEAWAQKNLTLAYLLTYLFATADTDVRHTLDPDQMNGLRDTLHSGMQNITEAQGLIDNLRGAPPYLMWHASWGLQRIRQRNFAGLPFDGWPDFSSQLLNAAALEPQLVIPQLSPFVVSESRTERDFEVTWTYSPDLAARLFDLESLKTIVSNNPISTDSLRPNVREMYLAMRGGLLDH
ncbi:MAG: P-loop NTPase fold protein [Myxococcota bacterium]